MITPLLGGLWSSPSIGFPDRNELMMIDLTRKRLIVFTWAEMKSLKLIHIPSWFEQAESAAIHLRYQPSKPWHTHHYRMDGDIIYWTYGGCEHAWHQVNPVDYPPWLHERLEKIYQKMDEKEIISAQVEN